MEKGVPIRSISRSLALLQAINRAGSLTMMEAAHAAKVPYPTASRIMQTLIEEGLIEREPVRKRYRATALVQSLSSGFQAHNRLIRAARPHMIDLTRALNWPISIATRVGQSMVVRDSTHALSSLTFNNYYPGYTLPILKCASGRVFIAFSDESVRGEILKTARDELGEDGAKHVSPFDNPDFIEGIRADGYASFGRSFHNANPGLTSALAVPLFGDGALLGAMTLTFFASAMGMADAAAAYVGPLKQAAAKVVRDLDNPRPPTRDE